MSFADDDDDVSDVFPTSSYNNNNNNNQPRRTNSVQRMLSAQGILVSRTTMFELNIAFL